MDLEKEMIKCPKIIDKIRYLDTKDEMAAEWYRFQK